MARGFVLRATWPPLFLIGEAVPLIRLLAGSKPGTIVYATPLQADTQIAAGRAELVGPEQPETPERSVRRRRKPETRGS